MNGDACYSIHIRLDAPPGQIKKPAGQQHTRRAKGNQFNTLCSMEVLGRIAQADEERAAKLRQAVKAALEQMGVGS